jgi:hypothetical protein
VSLDKNWSRSIKHFFDSKSIKAIYLPVLVVLTMVANPDPEAILPGERVHVEEKDLQPSFSLKCSVTEVTMSAHRNALSSHINQPNCWRREAH